MGQHVQIYRESPIGASNIKLTLDVLRALFPFMY
jgi:hypothetical protein